MLEGKGFFTWKIPRCENGDAGQIAAHAKSAELSHMLLKVADGTVIYNGTWGDPIDYTTPVVNALRSLGIQVWGWHYIYGDYPTGEANVAIARIKQYNLDGYVLDVEKEYKESGKRSAAKQFMARLRAACPNLTIALSSFRYPSLHPQVPWTEFLEQCDLNMPQVYWLKAHNPGDQLERSVAELQAKKPSLPVVPTGAAFREFGWQPTESEVEEFFNKAKELNLSAVNFWEWSDARSGIIPGVWDVIKNYQWSGNNRPKDICEILIDALNSHNVDKILGLYGPPAIHVSSQRTTQGMENLHSWYSRCIMKPCQTANSKSEVSAERVAPGISPGQLHLPRVSSAMETTPSGFRKVRSITITHSLLFPRKLILQTILAGILFGGLFSSCNQPPTQVTSITASPVPSKTITLTAAPTRTSTPTLTVTPRPSNTATPTRTSTSSPTLSPLEMFTSKNLRQGVLPMTYLADQCTFLQKRWSPDGSRPGTVVVPIMFHSIVQNGSRIIDTNRDISANQYLAFIAYAQSLGFETITSQELLEFLHGNARIPPRSMLIIVDDRRPGLIREWIMPVLEKYDWTVTSAYIADPNTLAWAWNLMDQLFASGRLDVQSHGYSGQLYIVEDTPLEKIQSEIWNSTTVLEERFGLRPLAFIWPGGNFTPLSVQVARQGGYELGFTAYSRGPLMFNWIPLGEDERAVNDPLMVLPRAWSSAANANLYEAVKISEQAADFAEQNFQTEADWYRIYCGGELINQH